jgi:hypothetical protein
MGTALRFSEEARACAVAHFLAARGFGVLWEPGKPHVVMCSAEREELRPIIREYKAVDEEWYKRKAVDVGCRGGTP